MNNHLFKTDTSEMADGTPFINVPATKNPYHGLDQPETVTVTIPNGFNFTSSAELTRFVDLHAVNEDMGYEMCAWIDDVYFNDASRTRKFNVVNN